MVTEDICNTVLSLGSAGSIHKPDNNFQSRNHPQHNMKFDHVIPFPSQSLGLSPAETKVDVINPQGSNSISTGSSYYFNKREIRDLCGEEELGIKIKVPSKEISTDDEEGMNSRKKLRLTKKQSLILEETFKERSTLLPKQKQALAKQLNLRLRQVEVWFQNRRARTKSKQTEVQYDNLKKHRETLAAENRRLQKELEELKAVTIPCYMQYPPAATHNLCPSCQRIDSAGGGKYSSDSKTFFLNWS